MAANTSKHQVVIVGGGVTGLVLALCLERLQVDYVLFEAYGEIAPDAGASILILPNGQRILDQLGVLEKVAAAGLPQGHIVYRDGVTAKNLRHTHAADEYRKRHGYNSLWSSRHRIMRALSEAVADKHRLLTNKRVVRIDDSRPDAAVVYTDDGCVYEAQVVAGCDGVHSTVRQEMWRHADLEDPKCVPAADRAEVACEYACLFGAGLCSPKVQDGIPENWGALVSLQDAQIVLGRGLDNEIYMLCTWALPQEQQRCAIDGVPRFQKEEQERAMDKFRDVVVADNGLRMQDLFENLIRSGVTALPHYTLRKWSHGRIICLGDAVHKFNPVAGQGGNSCIDSCAMLINALQEHIAGDLGGMTAWPVAGLRAAFRDVEESSFDRTSRMVEESQDMIRMLSWRRWRDKLTWRYVIPYVPESVLLKPHSMAIVGGARLKGKQFRHPKIEHNWPYDDE